MSAASRVAPVGLGEFVPLLRRLDTLDPETLVRLRPERAPGEGTAAAAALTLFAALPFDVLVSRTLAWDASSNAAPAATAHAGELLRWAIGEAEDPSPRDDQWRGALPPARGWARLDVLDDAVIRDRVRVGAIAVKELTDNAGEQEQVRQTAIEALLDSIVLTVAAGDPQKAPPGERADIPLRTVSALTRMGFVPRGSQVAVDVCRGWIRVGARYGAAYAAARLTRGPGRPGSPGLLPIAR
jgi:hypothetical protein